MLLHLKKLVSPYPDTSQWLKNIFSFISENNVMTDMGVGSYVNPTLFGIMGGLALMFIVMCVVLRLFAK